MGDWTPTPEWYADLLSHDRKDDDRSRPYPFFLAAPLEDPIENLGPPAGWIVEWKWVEPVHVFELGFEAIARSSRHRSGIAVRFPRMLRWRTDKKADEADTLQTVQKLLTDER
jgi:ATP-dependent DNA ligase